MTMTQVRLSAAPSVGKLSAPPTGDVCNACFLHTHGVWCERPADCSCWCSRPVMTHTSRRRVVKERRTLYPTSVPAGGDPRFSFQFVADVIAVFEEHGYPMPPRDRLNLDAALWRFLHERKEPR